MKANEFPAGLTQEQIREFYECIVTGKQSFTVTDDGISFEYKPNEPMEVIRTIVKYNDKGERQ